VDPSLDLFPPKVLPRSPPRPTVRRTPPLFESLRLTGGTEGRLSFHGGKSQHPLIFFFLVLIVQDLSSSPVTSFRRRVCILDFVLRSTFSPFLRSAANSCGRPPRRSLPRIARPSPSPLRLFFFPLWAVILPRPPLPLAYAPRLYGALFSFFPSPFCCVVFFPGSLRSGVGSCAGRRDLLSEPLLSVFAFF